LLLNWLLNWLSLLLILLRRNHLLHDWLWLIFVQDINGKRLLAQSGFSKCLFKLSMLLVNKTEIVFQMNGLHLVKRIDALYVTNDI